MSKRLLNSMTLPLLIASVVAISACQPGDFCVVVRSPIEFAPETAAQVVRTDRPEAEQIDAQNAYWRGNC